MDTTTKARILRIGRVETLPDGRFLISGWTMDGGTAPVYDPAHPDRLCGWGPHALRWIARTGVVPD